LQLFDVSFPRLFGFIAFSGVSQRWEFSKTPPNKLQQKRVIHKNSTENPKTVFFSVLFDHVFGRFSVRGVQKHD
jgi:hypothetical protein